MQIAVNAVRGARPQVRTQHPVQADGGLEQRAVEAFVGDIVNVDGGDAQQLPHIRLAEGAQRPAQLGQRQAVPPLPFGQARRSLGAEPSQHLGEAPGLAVKFRIGGGVLGGNAFHLGAVDGQLSALPVQRHRFEVGGGKLQAMFLQGQVLGDLGVQRGQQMG